MEDFEREYVEKLEGKLFDLKWEMHLASLGATGEEEILSKRVEALELKILRTKAFFGML